MSSILPVNIEDLLHCSGIESARVEFKASWDEKTTGVQIVKTICAFANDFQNINGGYIVLGVAEQDGKAVLPPQGIEKSQIDSIQRWLIGHCKQIEPDYEPVFSPEVVDGKQILVIWAFASDARPHKAPTQEVPKEKKYYIRIGSETIAAQKNQLQQLLQMTSRVPFDDRKAMNARIEDMREAKVREFLSDVSSGLLDEQNTKEVYRKLRIAVPVNSHDVPRNIGLLMFSEDAGAWFPGARIEVAVFPNGEGDIIEEQSFSGGLHEQLRNAIRYLETVMVKTIQKDVHSSIYADKYELYPIDAVREALANAVYHRSYDVDCPDPIRVYIYPDRMVIASYPGPVPGLRPEHFLFKKPMPLVTARNRRIGEFLKELHLAEERMTGIRKIYNAMKRNASPQPLFEFDEGRTYFQVTLPIHE
jgi:ATP-dependent DNA helicase RecG